MNARTLSVNLYKAAQAAYCPASKMSKQAKTLPILHHYRIRTHAGLIELAAVDTSGETWETLIESAPAIVEREFDLCVPMRPFRDWLSVTAKYKGVLELTADSDTLIVRDGNTCARFYGMSADEFPTTKGQNV